MEWLFFVIAWIAVLFRKLFCSVGRVCWWGDKFLFHCYQCIVWKVL